MGIRNNKLTAKTNQSANRTIPDKTNIEMKHSNKSLADFEILVIEH